MPRSFADVVTLMTPDQFSASVFRSVSFVEYNPQVGTIGSRAMSRRTLVTATRPGNDVAHLDRFGNKVFPTVFDLRYGEWIDEIMG